ncbi:MAG: response regulator transcription factor [Acidimicrobiia bacterium]
MHILLIEDDDSIAEPLTTGLARDGFVVTRAATGAAVFDVIDWDAAPPEFVLLDLGLPDADGADLCRALRARSGVPIIVVTARGDEIDRVVLLELGADDYVVKPFGFRELVARIRAVARRTQPSSDPALAVATIGGLEIDYRARRVTLDGNEVGLTPKEFDLLAFLAGDPGAVYRRETILDEVWDPHWYGPTKTLDVHVAAVRKKLGDAGWIETVRGVGFRLVVPQPDR